MKRKILFLIGLIIAGTFAYYGGYHVYKINNPKVELIEPESLQRAVQLTNDDSMISKEYYVGKIEQDMLMIYKMPEEILYDSVEMGSLCFYEDEEQKLLEGMVFEDLMEVYEFLENSMS